jgi:hypothetical protein
VGIDNNKLTFLDTSDKRNRPMTSHSFQRATAGTLRWEFKFDWARTGSEGTYYLFMQLGDGALMGDQDQQTGVAVNLLWAKIDGVHETLGYDDGRSTTALAGLSGLATLVVDADLDQGTYAVSIDGIPIQSGIPFDNTGEIDTVRFFTDLLNERRFSGMSFDDLLIEGSGG